MRLSHKVGEVRAGGGSAALIDAGGHGPQGVRQWLGSDLDPDSKA